MPQAQGLGWGAGAGMRRSFLGKAPGALCGSAGSLLWLYSQQRLPGAEREGDGSGSEVLVGGGGCAQPCQTSSDLGSSPSVSAVLLTGTESTKHCCWFHPVPALVVTAVW